jgi:hypothetical protein
MNRAYLWLLLEEKVSPKVTDAVDNFIFSLKSYTSSGAPHPGSPESAAFWGGYTFSSRRRLYRNKSSLPVGKKLL